MDNYKHLDLPVGFRFIHEEAVLEVRKALTCDKCYFCNHFSECAAFQFLCGCNAREDSTDVSFIKIADIPKITKK